MEENSKKEAEVKRETIQLEREQIREKIRELIEAEYAGSRKRPRGSLRNLIMKLRLKS